jgi:type II secretory pathway component PulJ
VTLVEMLVSVALLVLMMTVIVQVFAAATGAVSTARTFQELDQSLRHLDGVLRQDLQNVTARFTPPLDPDQNLGYFEYIENTFADIQGEDTDDCIRFTVKAPEGQYFTGRMVVPPSFPPGGVTPAFYQYYYATQPITINSQYAEVIYFLRNGNLYRRVLLVAPERQSSISQFPIGVGSVGGTAYYTSSPFTSLNGNGYLPVSWQGVNDLSARPAPYDTRNLATGAAAPILLNTLGDLTNRENRWSYQRFANDFVVNGNAPSGAGDGVPDDENSDGTNNKGDGMPDFYPTLYAGVFNALPNHLVWSMIATGGTGAFNPSYLWASVPAEDMAFPYIFPGAYSKPDTNSAANNLGWIHSPDPTNNQLTVQALNALNHNPIDLGDSLPVPPAMPAGGPIPPSYQTWWGFPTWRETMSPNWDDPQHSWFTAAGGFNIQPFGLHPLGTVPNNMLPPMTAAFRPVEQPYTDQAGLNLLSLNGTPAPLAATDANGVWVRCWEDDLILTGVRSFDVKAYDDTFPGYVDLGWGDDLRLYPSAVAATLNGNPPLLASTPLTFNWPPTSTSNPVTLSTMAHEGRMPPLNNDLRLDPTVSNPNYPAAIPFPLTAYTTLITSTGYNGNVGDNNTGVVRLRRVWDSWSTDYSNVQGGGYDPLTFFPLGPPFTPPIYPSYPPPYPAPLKGIQVQIRVVDPRNQQIKVLTIRQDFTDRL